MESFSEILKYLNIPQTLVLIVALWFFYNRLDNKIEKVRDELKGEIKDLNKRLDDEIKALNKKIDDESKAMNNRLDNIYQLIVTIFRKDVA